MSESLQIAYVMPSLACCGGHRIILEHAVRLTRRGHGVRLVVADARDQSLDWYPLAKDAVQIAALSGPRDWLDGLDCVVATFNETAWDVLALPGHLAKFYFVQSDERPFYPRDSEAHARCDATYRQRDLTIITEALWIKQWLAESYGRQAILAPNGINFDHFYPEPTILTDGSTVLVEGDAHEIRKGVRDAVRALEDVDCQTWLLTNSDPPLPEYTTVFDRIFNRPPHDHLRQIYSSADVLLKPSYHEGSPLPHMEAMVCETAVVTTNCCGTNEHCHNEFNCLIVPVGGVYEMRSAVIRLMHDDAFRGALVARAAEFARKHFAWDKSMDSIERAFRDGAAARGGSAVPAAGRAADGPVDLVVSPADLATASEDSTADSAPPSGTSVELIEAETLREAIRSIQERIPRVDLRSVLICGNDGPGQVEPIGEIHGARTLCQTIQWLTNDLCGIRLLLGTYGRTNRHTLTIELQTESGAGLWSGSVDAAELQDRQWRTILFPRILNSGDQVLRLVLSAPDGHEGNAVTAYRDPDREYVATRLAFNGQQLDGCLCLSLLYYQGNQTADTLLALAGAGLIVPKPST